MILYKFPHSPTIRELNDLPEAWCPLCSVKALMAKVADLHAEYQSIQLVIDR